MVAVAALALYVIENPTWSGQFKYEIFHLMGYWPLAKSTEHTLIHWNIVQHSGRYSDLARTLILVDKDDLMDLKL